MIATLGSEEAQDLERKETCEKNRASDARDAAVNSRKVDEMSDAIASLLADISQIDTEIAANQQQVKETEAELAEATKIRASEHAEFLVAKKDDDDAIATVGSAKAVLASFYKENGLMLVQKKKPGQAPNPPPPTWEAPYGGKTDESTGIIALLEMVQDDMKKDLAKASAEDAAAEKAFQTVKADLETRKADLEASIVALNSQKAEKEQTVSETKEDKRMKKDEIKALLESMADAAKGCDFFTVNYDIRRKNRQTEIDGLNKAKAILEGAAFSTEDEGRELKPGDALLQRRLRH
jgi:peptidoglycan hydrolase CwlO-like protein